MLTLIHNAKFRRYRVLHKCANPTCPNPFRKLSHGKLFLVETPPLEGLATSTRTRGPSSPRIEYYWLCDQCAFALTLSYEKGRGVVAVPLPAVAKRLPAMGGTVRGMTRNESSQREQSA
jgi:hypothetical protein